MCVLLSEREGQLPRVAHWAIVCTALYSPYDSAYLEHVADTFAAGPTHLTPLSSAPLCAREGHL